MFNWTAEAIEKLRGLWMGGDSTLKIARAMGLSKNAVVGKAHRLGLPGRPIPIRERGAPPPPPRAGRHTLPVFGASPVFAPAVPPGASPHPAKATARPGSDHAPAKVNPSRGAVIPADEAGRVGAGLSIAMPGSVVAGTAEALRRGRLATQVRRDNADRRIDGRSDALLPKPLAAVPRAPSADTCRWPIGEPRTPGFRFCDAAEVVQGRSYCRAHCERAYVRPGQERAA